MWGLRPRLFKLPWRVRTRASVPALDLELCAALASLAVAEIALVTHQAGAWLRHRRALLFGAAMRVLLALSAADRDPEGFIETSKHVPVAQEALGNHGSSSRRRRMCPFRWNTTCRPVVAIETTAFQRAGSTETTFANSELDSAVLDTKATIGAISTSCSSVNGHRFLPTGGHLIPHWWPSFLPTGGHQMSPPVAIVSPQQGVGLVFR